MTDICDMNSFNDVSELNFKVNTLTNHALNCFLMKYEENLLQNSEFLFDFADLKFIQSAYILYKHSMKNFM